tara:strand:+ start:131 stop:280 length:150 start_codon:yes stop_codon:yes gene_type:complete
MRKLNRKKTELKTNQPELNIIDSFKCKIYPIYNREMKNARKKEAPNGTP